MVQDSKMQPDDSPPPFWVVRKVKQPHGGGLATWTELPEGFSYVVDDNSGAVCEHILLFLYEEYTKLSKRDFAVRTVRAYAYDCKEWMHHCVDFGFPWHAATKHDIDTFVSVMRSTVSPFTGKEYATTTISRRRTTVELLYAWGKKEGIARDIAPKGSLLNPAGEIDSQDSQEKSSRARNKKRPGEKTHVSVMERPQARAILEQLGPLPKPVEPMPVSANESGSSRARLAGEIAIQAALRIEEVADLKAKTFAAFANQTIHESRAYSIQVCGKGNKTLPVLFPGELMVQIQTYLNGERREIVSQFGEHNAKGALLLNPASSGPQFAGKPATVRTMEREFHDACIRSGNYEIEPIQEFDETGKVTGQKSYVKRPLFVFHDLRHSCAVWTYYARKRAGDTEPWLYIQTLLRHEDLTTTLRTYLKITHSFEASVSDKYMADTNAQT
ncbi:tyrosine-type recombinase/integrase [Burkholderia pseudomallei]|uniref:tyrosine-type recombinase/integrase n=1 Tax=Burkholderia pseudomallei TaxID=28450 RepID=UPI001AD7B2D3|nr:site-specific integrase [Burkholderia pseudomallei]MBO7825951.1 site-specific integrase [Burkholderia pseudomallei]